MKKILFWVLFVPYGVLMLTAAVLSSIFDDISNWMYHTGVKFEDWCLDNDTK